jgi:drug/metabolite transporter (DMT)-like permease
MKAINKTGHLAILTVNVIFGLNTIASKTLMPDFLSPKALTLVRMFGAFLLFFAASFFIKKEKIAKKDYLLLFFASFIGLFINQFAFIEGLSYTSPIDAALVVTILPILTMLISAAYLKEPITKLKVFGVLLGGAGALLIIFNASFAITKGSFLGNFLCFISCLSYALYLVFFKGLMGKYHPITIMKLMFFYASVIAVPFCGKDFLNINYTALPAMVYWQIAYVVIGATFITYLLIPIAIRDLRPTTVSMYNYSQPLVAAFAAVMLGLDNFSFIKLVAAFLIFLGVFLVTQSKSRADMEK